MKITLFSETLPYKNSGVINPVKKTSCYKDSFWHLKKTLSEKLDIEVSYIEDTGNNFPKEGIVLYEPYSLEDQSGFLQTLDNPTRIILFNVTGGWLRSNQVISNLGGAIGTGSFFEQYYPERFELYIKEKLALDFETSTVKKYHGLTLLLDESFKTLPEALAWYIKELYKSGLVKE